MRTTQAAGSPAAPSCSNQLIFSKCVSFWSIQPAKPLKSVMIRKMGPREGGRETASAGARARQQLDNEPMATSVVGAGSRGPPAAPSRPTGAIDPLAYQLPRPASCPSPSSRSCRGALLPDNCPPLHLSCLPVLALACLQLFLRIQHAGRATAQRGVVPGGAGQSRAGPRQATQATWTPEAHASAASNNVAN